MKKLIGILLLCVALPAFALDIAPYTPAALSQAQAANKPVALHFHADWCPTCRAQSQVFQGWAGDASVPGTLLVVNYDQEKALKQQYRVRSQSTLIFLQAGQERQRLSGVTDPQALRRAILGQP
jgi:thiol-disulfide isomerase/thioredoxin